MDKNQIEGIGHLVKGAVKERLGKIIGDAKFTADGSAERASGEGQYASSENALVGIDSDRLKGIAHQIKGAVREGLGTVTGNPALEADGLAERGAGKAQNAVGGVKDTAREALKIEKAETEKAETEKAKPEETKPDEAKTETGK